MPYWLRNIDHNGIWVPGGVYSFEVYDEGHTEYVGPPNWYHDWGKRLATVVGPRDEVHCFFHTPDDRYDDYEEYITIIGISDVEGGSGEDDFSWTKITVKVDIECPTRLFFLKFIAYDEVYQIEA